MDDKLTMTTSDTLSGAASLGWSPQADAAFEAALAKAVKDDPLGEPSKALGWARLSRAIDAERAQSPKAHSILPRYMAAALAVVALGQVVFFVASVENGAGDDARYATVSEAVADHTARVRFVPTATEQDMRAMLRRAGADLVEGPSAQGFYMLSFQDREAMTKAAALFEDRPDIVAYFSAEDPE